MKILFASTFLLILSSCQNDDCFAAHTFGYNLVGYMHDCGVNTACLAAVSEHQQRLDELCKSKKP
jgi:hypothetical protein